MKRSEVYLNDYDSPRQAHGSLATYMGFYNQARPHQALGYLTLAQVYFGHAASDQKTSRNGGLHPGIQTG